MRRHLEGAQLEYAQSSCGTVRRIEFIDTKLGTMGVAGNIGQQMAQQAINQPRRWRFAFRHLLKGDFQFIKFFIPAFIDARRLTGRADKHA